jgi:SPP1 family predicted phage head-tail adaptor
MRFDRTIDLLGMSEDINENGFPTSSITSRKTIFAKKSSIKSNEFYSAAQSGFSLEIMFEVLTLEYESEKYVEFETKLYKIIRSYEKDRITELICQAYADST